MKRIRLLAVLAALLAAVPLAPAPARADGLAEELKGRRERLMRSLDPGTIAILWSAPVQTYSRDVEYEYRQDSDLLYLTGVSQPDTILVLMPGNRSRRANLFIRPADAVREHWDGHRLTKQEATALTGIAAVYESPQFDTFLSLTFDEAPFDPGSRRPSPDDDEYATFFAAVAAGRAKIGLRLPPVPRALEPLGADALRRRIRRDELRVLVLDLLQPPHEAVVLGVRDRRAIEHVVGVVVRLDTTAQGLELGLQLRGAGRACHAGRLSAARTGGGTR